MQWSGDLSCTVHLTDHALITWLIMHESSDYHARLTLLIMQYSHSYNVLVTWLSMHWSRNWSCTNHVPDHALIAWLIIHWSRDWSCTDHVTEHALITWLWMSTKWRAFCSSSAITFWTFLNSCCINIFIWSRVTYRTETSQNALDMQRNGRVGLLF